MMYSMYINQLPHFGGLFNLFFIATFSTARECYHVHFISEMKDQERASFPENPNDFLAKFLNWRSKSQSLVICSAPELLNLFRNPIIGKPSISFSEVHNFVCFHARNDLCS